MEKNKIGSNQNLEQKKGSISYLKNLEAQNKKQKKTLSDDPKRTGAKKRRNKVLFKKEQTEQNHVISGLL